MDLSTKNKKIQFSGATCCSFASYLCVSNIDSKKFKEEFN